MILTLANWCYVFVLSYLIGIGVTKLLYKVCKYHIVEWEMKIILGIVVLTVYAQGFSLFAPVGKWANVVLCIMAVILAFLCRKELYLMIHNVLSEKRNSRVYLNVILVGVIILVFSILSCQRAIHADTDGYHAQSIRWIEEYGVVKGLGNLYHRFAYNSAFLCLQALFSWKFLVGQSMHVMNGFLCCIMFLYGVQGLLKRNKSLLGNMFRILLLLFIVAHQSISVMSSPNTDTFALLLVVFVLSKWCDLLEQKEISPIPYALLSVLAFFAISVKLSTALLVFFSVKPLCSLIKERKWRMIVFFMVLVAFVLFPFLCRNLLISGYLIYPYKFSDLFDVCWKMNPFMVECDKREIVAWGRALYDINKSDYHLWQWFPVWWKSQDIWLKVMTVLNIILCIPGIGLTCKYVMDKDFDEALLIAEIVIMPLGWFFTAPLQRYGIVFLFLLPVYFMGLFTEKCKIEKTLNMAKAMPIILCGILLVIEVKNVESIPLKRSSYYVKRECEMIEWNGISVYLPIENGYMGYYYFPSTQHKEVLSVIQLIGTTVKDGFMVKKEYRDVAIGTNGKIL